MADVVGEELDEALSAVRVFGRWVLPFGNFVSLAPVVARLSDVSVYVVCIFCICGACVSSVPTGDVSRRCLGSFVRYPLLRNGLPSWFTGYVGVSG